MNQVQVEQKSYQMPPQDGFTVAYFLTEIIVIAAVRRRVIAAAPTGEMRKGPPVDARKRRPDDRRSETAASKAATHVSGAAEPARKRVSGQHPGESGSRCQDDHGLT